MNNEEIKDFLIDTEILSKDQVKQIQDQIFTEGSEKSFLEMALDLNLIKPEIAKEILAMILSIPQIDLENKIIDLETYAVLPEPVCREKKVVVFENNNKDVSVAISDFEILDEIKELFPEDTAVNYFLAEDPDINKKIIQYQNLLRENWDASLFSILPAIPKLKDFGFSKYDEIPEEYYREITDNYYIERFLESLFEYALSSKAEYIYFDCEENNYGIYFRIFSERYKIMEISKETAVSLILKLKKFADINIHNKATIKEAQFKAELFSKIHDIYLSFIQTNVGTSVAIQIDKKIVFPFSFSKIIPTQQEVYFRNAEKSSGLVLLSDISSLVSLAEIESKKNKEIYSITTKPAEYKIPTINHLSLKKGEKKSLLIPKILKNRPDIIFLDSITKSLLPILMNFVTTGKKVYLELENNFFIFIEQLINSSIDKSRIIKNISYLIEHQKFEKIFKENQKKYKLSSVDQKKIFSFISEKELLEKLQEANIINKKIKKLSKITFYTVTKHKSFLQKKNQDKIMVRGIFEISELLENAFINKNNTNQIKAQLMKIAKKSILENALVLSIQGLIDVKDILKYLTK